MSLLDMLLGRQAQVNEKPIVFEPLQLPQNQPQPQQQPAQQSPLLKQIMLNNNGGMISQADINKFYHDGMMNAQNQQMEEQPIISGGLDATPEKTGLLQDLISGYKDNANNGFQVDNLRPVADKSLANKVGESFGTFKRFATSPYGAGLLSAAVGTAMGGDGAAALSAGLNAGTKNQTMANQDKLYRESLKNEDIDTSNISGYLNSDDYEKITNANYKNAYRKYLMDKTVTTAKSKTITLGELMNVSPEYKKYIMSQYDFSNGQNADLLEQEMPVDMLKNTGWLPKEVNMNYSGHTSKEIHKSGSTTSNIVHSGGTNSTKTNYGAKYPEPVKDGTVIRNKETGERMVRKGGKWQKL